MGETIVAESSPCGMGRGARRGMVRLSGDYALDAAASLMAMEPDRCRVLGFARETVATAYDATLCVGGDSAPIVPGLFLCWHRGRSFTGELLVEIHTVASPPILQAIVRRLLTHPEVRLAERGEFTLRALTAGRLDLTQAEAILGVIHATDEVSLAAALRQLAGGLRHELDTVYQHLTDTLAVCEASLDFADEETTIVTPEILATRMAAIRGELTTLKRRVAMRSNASGDLPSVVIAGRANAGKSTLWNALTTGYNRSLRAIVSPEAGTTRDILSAEIRDTAIPFCLVDTAGFTDAGVGTDATNAEAQWRTREVVAAATLIVHCHAADDIGDVGDEQNIQDADPVRTICVVTKGDTLAAGQTELLSLNGISGVDVVVSAHTGAGIAALREVIGAHLAAHGGTGDVVASTSVRAVAALQTALESLDAADTVLTTLGDESLVADELHRAARAVGDLIGIATTPDDILSTIFSRFCLGK